MRAASATAFRRRIRSWASDLAYGAVKEHIRALRKLEAVRTNIVGGKVVSPHVVHLGLHYADPDKCYHSGDDEHYHEFFDAITKIIVPVVIHSR